jgi:hypothetical protein
MEAEDLGDMPLPPAAGRLGLCTAGAAAAFEFVRVVAVA